MCSKCGMMTVGNWKNCQGKVPCSRPMSYVAPLPLGGSSAAGSGSESGSGCTRCELRRAGDPTCGPGGATERGCWRMFWEILKCSMRNGSSGGDGESDGLGPEESDGLASLVASCSTTPKSKGNGLCKRERKRKRSAAEAGSGTGTGMRRSSVRIMDRMKRLRLTSYSAPQQDVSLSPASTAPVTVPSADADAAVEDAAGKTGDMLASVTARRCTATTTTAAAASTGTTTSNATATRFLGHARLTLGEEIVD